MFYATLLFSFETRIRNCVVNVVVVDDDVVVVVVVVVVVNTIKHLLTNLGCRLAANKVHILKIVYQFSL